MSTIVTRAGKGSPLTHTEVDNNFTNLNTDKLQSGDTAASLAISSADINGGTIDGTSIGSSSASTGAFTSLSASGSFSANGGATLGDASGDALTINSSAVSIPNGLNFDSNTLVIDATNNRVGIGTASPTTSLTIASGNANISNGSFDVARTTYPVVQLQQTGSTGIGQFAMNGNNLEIRQTQAFDTLFYTNNTERMRINSSGNVGIGTSSPNTKLHVNGSARASSFNGTFSTTITTGGSAVNFNQVGLILVTGNLTTGGNDFNDLVLVQFYGGISVISSAIFGSPSNRTYGIGGNGALTISLSGGTSGTYNLRALFMQAP